MVVANKDRPGAKSLMDIGSKTSPEVLPAKVLLPESSKRNKPVSVHSTLDTVNEETSAQVKRKSVVEKDERQASKSADVTFLPVDIKTQPSPFLTTSQIDQAAYQQSLAYYAAQSAAAAAAVHNLPPLGYPVMGAAGQPLSCNTNEGRYYFNPAFHPANPSRVLGSPTQTDVSFLSNPSIPGSLVSARLYWETRLQQQMQPTSLVDSSKKSIFSDIPATPGSGSITLPPSLNSSRLTSPYPSVVGGKGRKRALSHSPLSECLDIQSLTRSSEGSLHLTPLLHNPNSRSSSVASGSYGHLSAGSLSSLTPTLKSASPYLQAAAAAAASYYPMPFPMPAFPTPSTSHFALHSIPSPLQISKPPKAAEIDSSQGQDQTQQTDKGGGSSVVSSTVPGIGEDQPVKVESEEGQDFKETVCRWLGCSQEFAQHDDLVKHVNHDHIGANKKFFVCKWAQCCRQEKPFKAQYMLVVHMRRHTGEKPHKCQGFPGCNKAYSRLENLKTHMRSHTGERPYLCEYPGCQKAFSNASDRAKHQNRTHSNDKPYACEIDGCSKRYTDPSSLRKHVKTVHGAEFYARKKHKGLDTPGCRASKAAEANSSKKDDDRTMQVEECLKVTGLTSGEQPNIKGSHTVKDEGSPQNETADVEINILRAGGVQLLPSTVMPVTGISNTLGTVDELVEDELTTGVHEEENGGILVQRTLQPNSRNIKAKMATKTSMTSLPSLPNMPGTLRKKLSSKETGLRSHNLNTLSVLRGNELPKIIEPSSNTSQLQVGPRRDSNTSTLSSYMSSLRSDASPAIFNSRFSSRRSSDVSQSSARLSIMNSPYEYDLTGNIPEPHSRELHQMTDQMERTQLGSQPNLYIQSHALNLQGSVAKWDKVRDGWRTATPAHTPLPHEYPQYERRRASDPVRCADPNFSELKKLQHRFYSLNAVRPLPIPANMKSLSGRNYSHETFLSSQSSIATNPLPNYDGIDYEANLDMKMIEDNEDVIIPDDMRQFLQQRQIDCNPNGISNIGSAKQGNNVDEWVRRTTSINHLALHANHPPDSTTPRDNGMSQSDHHHHRHPRLLPPLSGQHFENPHFSHSQAQQQNVMVSNPAQMYNPCNSYQCCGVKQPPSCSSPYPVGGHHHHYCHTNHVQPAFHHNYNFCNHNYQYQAPINDGQSLQNRTLLPQTSSQAVLPNQCGHYNYNYPTTYGNDTPHSQRYCGQQAAKPHLPLQQQLSPPCEVTSSTDRNSQLHNNGIQPTIQPVIQPAIPEELVAGDNVLDNLSSISAELQSLTSQNISSVSQVKQSAESAGNMVISNMSNILAHYAAEESKYVTPSQM